MLEPEEKIGLGAIEGEAFVNGRLARFQCPTFHFQVGLDIALEGLQVGVAQDVFDGDGRDSSLE
jgi:hypothetical protein